MKVTGTKCRVQIEDDAGNIARFDGEVCFREFCALADSIQWIRHNGEATDQDRIDLIYKATRYGKDTGTKILFFSSDGQVMFENELGLKTEVYWSKTYLVIVAVVVVSLLFPALFIASAFSCSVHSCTGCCRSELQHRVRYCDCPACQSIHYLGLSDMEIQDHSRG